VDWKSTATKRRDSSRLGRRPSTLGPSLIGVQIGNTPSSAPAEQQIAIVPQPPATQPRDLLPRRLGAVWWRSLFCDIECMRKEGACVLSFSVSLFCLCFASSCCLLLLPISFLLLLFLLPQLHPLPPSIHFLLPSISICISIHLNQTLQLRVTLTHVDRIRCLVASSTRFTHLVLFPFDLPLCPSPASTPEPAASEPAP